MENKDEKKKGCLPASFVLIIAGIFVVIICGIGAGIFLAIEPEPEEVTTTTTKKPTTTTTANTTTGTTDMAATNTTMVPSKLALSGGGCSGHGDGFCNDITNNQDCNYDGGDCCGPDVNTQYCTECQCLGCAKTNWVGDGFCDDFTNNPECTYDGGDCCGPDVDTKYCQECECLASRMSTKGTPNIGINSRKSN